MKNFIFLNMPGQQPFTDMTPFTNMPGRQPFMDMPPFTNMPGRPPFTDMTRSALDSFGAFRAPRVEIKNIDNHEAGRNSIRICQHMQI